MRAILLPLTFFLGRWSVFGDPSVTKWTNPINISSPESSGCDVCDKMVEPRLKEGWEVEEDDSRVHLATILTTSGAPIDQRYVFFFRHLLNSIFNHSRDVAIRLIIITDSLRPIKMLKHAVGKYLSEAVINDNIPAYIRPFSSRDFFRTKKILGIPNLKVELLDIRSIIKEHEDHITEMKKYYGPNNKVIHIRLEDPRREYYFSHQPPEHGVDIVFPPRYDRDLFFIAPFYHQHLPHLRQIIVVDLDIELRCSLSELSAQFDEFSDDQAMSIAANQSPYYYLATTAYRALNPDTQVGQPGKYQGLNTGVVLMDLEKMRQSDFYNKETKLESMVALHKSFLPSSDWGLGDQEWLTLLGWRNPSFIRQLPCQFNRQVTNTKGRERWMEYFSCKEKIKIMHLTPLW